MQVLYVVMVGTFPFNSFLSGFLCCVGLFSLAGNALFIVLQSIKFHFVYSVT